MVDFTAPDADLADAEQALDAAAVGGGILAGFGLDPTAAHATIEAAGEQMRYALERLAAGE
ncbi:hypothetical protein [Janibacter terrae]|uniref:hypothetical protein n=1 Tax=Janibacter terrae TaxID=103817 RepID=UPI0031F98272